MRIKKKNKNEYILAENIWVRNFVKSNFNIYIDINNLIEQKDYPLLLKNESKNNILNVEKIDSCDIKFKKCIIISDGFDFENKLSILDELNCEDTCIFAVNGALKKWSSKHKINYFVINNPYKECLLQLPTNGNYPKCIFSSRTNPDFLKKYKGRCYKYAPVPQESYDFGRNNGYKYKVDDYRNPICACINLAYHFDVKKILFISCDDSFSTDRPGSVKLENGLYTYPQQITVSKIMDANLYWLNQLEEDKPMVLDYSSGVKMNNAAYITSKDEIVELFNEF